MSGVTDLLRLGKTARKSRQTAGRPVVSKEYTPLVAYSRVRRVVPSSSQQPSTQPFGGQGFSSPVYAMQPVSPQNDQEEKRIDSGVVDDDTVTATTDVKMEDVGGAVVEDGSSSRMVETPPPAAAEKTTKDTWPWRRTSQDGSDAGGDHEDGSSRSPLSEPVGSSITTGRRAAAQGSFSAVETATMTGGGDPTAIEESSSRDIRSSPSDDVLSASHPASFLRAEQEEDVGATEDVKVEKGERSTTTPVSQDEGKSSTTEMMVKQEGLDETPSSTSVTAADQERRGSHPLPQPSTSADAVSSDKQQEQQEIKESTPTDHVSPPSTSSPGSAAAPETRPIDMARLMNSIEATRRAAELQQRLSAVATRGSGSALDPVRVKRICIVRETPIAENPPFLFLLSHTHRLTASLRLHSTSDCHPAAHPP